MRNRDLPRLRDVLDEAHALVRGLHFTVANKQHVLVAALLGRILEEAEGVYAMLERRDSACSFILLRSLLEAVVDLRNIVKDAGYSDFMYVALIDQRRRMLETAVERNSTNPYLAGIAADQDAAAKLDAIRSELENLRQQGTRPLRVWEKFERADQMDYYGGPYAHLCLHSHNNLEILISRHLDISDEDCEIRVFRPISEEEIQLIASTLADITANAVATVHDLLDGDAGSELGQLSEKLATLRALWKEAKDKH